MEGPGDIAIEWPDRMDDRRDVPGDIAIERPVVDLKDGPGDFAGGSSDPGKPTASTGSSRKANCDCGCCLNDIGLAKNSFDLV